MMLDGLDLCGFAGLKKSDKKSQKFCFFFGRSCSSAARGVPGKFRFAGASVWSCCSGGDAAGGATPMGGFTVGAGLSHASQQAAPFVFCSVQVLQTQNSSRFVADGADDAGNVLFGVSVTVFLFSVASAPGAGGSGGLV
eukprot:CAMPEP_0197713564 /NCGR_PEP_ID=MMETSP1338-20131121/130523_1 /TAXON_ID=43686 ORGANISM="Pelagodinium beii, Strain RCC1491" /NCGR_SAMPLE_ID=MMETSP1338 /ASSEMBLY_ACC=CAM_ASM_000754 /LENGTH=138 /DNA_ID=CAMNT_0043297505 /DNA_START=168 /DNA_END=585 /DNA_ORIENTATION=-